MRFVYMIAFRARIEFLQASIWKLEQRLAEYRDMIEVLRTEQIPPASSSVESAPDPDMINNLRRRIVDLDTQLSNAKSKLFESQREIEKQTHERTNLAAEFETKHRLNDKENKAKLAILLSTIESLEIEKSQLVEAKLENGELKKQCSDLQLRLKEYITRLNRTEQLSVTESEKLQTDLIAVQTVFREKEDQVTRMEIEKLILSKTISVLENRINIQTCSNSQLQTRIGDLQNQSKENSTLKEQLQSLTVSCEQIKSLQTQLVSKDQELANLRLEFLNLTMSITSMKTSLVNTQMENSVLINENRKLKIKKKLIIEKIKSKLIHHQLPLS